MRLVRRLLAMREPASALGGRQPLVVAHDSVAIGYVSYDVTDAGIAYALGLRDGEPQDGLHSAQPPEGPPRLPFGMPSTQVCAISWSFPASWMRSARCWAASRCSAAYRTVVIRLVGAVPASRTTSGRRPAAT